MQHVFALMIDEQHCSDPIDLLQDDFTVRYSRRLSVARNILISFIEQTCKILKIDFKDFEEIHQKKLLDKQSGYLAYIFKELDTVIAKPYTKQSTQLDDKTLLKLYEEMVSSEVG